MHKKTSMALAAAFLISAVPAFAIKNQPVRAGSTGMHHETRQQIIDRWNELDRNRDGVVSRAEWSWDQGIFNQIDTNRDSVLTRSEARTAAAQWRREQRQGEQLSSRFRGMDTNRDGVITRSEWRGNDKSFRIQDTNGDGVITAKDKQKQRKIKQNAKR